MTTRDEAFEQWFEERFQNLNTDIVISHEFERAKSNMRYGYEAAKAEFEKEIAELKEDLELTHKDYQRGYGQKDAKITNLQADNQRLREALMYYADCNHFDNMPDGSVVIVDHGGVADVALSLTLAQSLKEHDAELIERCAKVCNEMVELRGVNHDHAYMADKCAEAIREMKGK